MKMCATRKEFAVLSLIKFGLFLTVVMLFLTIGTLIVFHVSEKETMEDFIVMGVMISIAGSIQAVTLYAAIDHLVDYEATDWTKK